MRNKQKLLLPFAIAVFFVFALFIPGNRVVSKDNEKFFSPDDDTLSQNNSNLTSGYTVELIPSLYSISQKEIIKAGLLYDVNQNKVIWSKNSESSFPVASLTKMMVALLTVEAIDSGKIEWDTPVTATKEATLISSSKVYLKYGALFTIYELLKASMISSANDACYLLAQFLGGTEKAFVKKMNEKALLLGMPNTCFSNSTGLPATVREKDNYSSPSDLLVLANQLLKHYEVVEISGRNGEYFWNGTQNFELKNHNKLTGEFSEVDGMKTGYTRKAGFCIVATANKNNNRLISIVLGSTSPLARNRFVTNLFNEYYDNVLCLGKLGESVQTGNASEIQNSKTSN